MTSTISSIHLRHHSTSHNISNSRMMTSSIEMRRVCRDRHEFWSNSLILIPFLSFNHHFINSSSFSSSKEVLKVNHHLHHFPGREGSKKSES
nr:hypothetical protein [Tanacetum cinerariifolium]